MPNRSPYARPSPRLLAAAVDWSISLVLPAIFAGLVLSAAAFAAIGAAYDSPEGYDGAEPAVLALGVLAAAIAVLWIACPLAYFAVYGGRGQTIGMKAAGIRIASAATRRPPGPGRAVARAGAQLLLICCAILLAAAAFGDAPASFGVARTVTVGAAAVVIVTGFLGHLWMFADGRTQTLLDRLCGVVLLAEAPPPS